MKGAYCMIKMRARNSRAPVKEVKQIPEKNEDEIFSCAFSQQKTTKLLQLSRENIKLSYRVRSQQH